MSDPTDALVEAHREYLAQHPCPGRVHVVYIPLGRDADEVWAEICTAGRLNGEIPAGGDWQVFECPGGDGCSCAGIDPAPTFRHFHNDRQVWPPLPVECEKCNDDATVPCDCTGEADRG